MDYAHWFVYGISIYISMKLYCDTVENKWITDKRLSPYQGLTGQLLWHCSTWKQCARQIRVML